MAKPRPYTRPKRIDLSQLGQSGDIAVLVADGFEAPDLTGIAGEAEQAGYRTQIVSPVRSLVSGRSETGEEMNFVVDLAPGEKPADAFAGLLLPGGEAHLARLADDQDARLLIQEFLSSGRPVCALGGAVATLAATSGKTGVEGDAALALNGDVFASSGETARGDAGALFVQTLKPVQRAA
jgi:putative intracellular protease/amidase